MGDEDIMYKPLLDDIHVEAETFIMNEDDFEIDMGSWDGLQGVKQENPVLKDKEKLATQ